MSAVMRELFKPSAHHARLLTDSKGPYGLCVESDLEDDVPGCQTTKRVVVRPDCTGPSSSLPTLFQFMPHGRHRWAMGSEWDLIERLHKLMLADRGIKLPRTTQTDKRDADYWRQWYGLRRSATRVINALLAELYATIPTERLRIVRRYPISYRKRIYAGLCGAGDRAWQLADTFPLLAFLVYEQRADNPNSEARNLVERGARLHVIAGIARVHMVFRRFKPAVLRLVLMNKDFLCRHPYLVAHHCPKTVPRQREWLSAIEQATFEGDDDFAVWVASRYEHIGHWREVSAIVGDVKDWVHATYQSKVAGSIKPVEVERIIAAMVATGEPHSADNLRHWWDSINKSCEGRAFHRNMAARTVLKLSHEWHERAAKAEAANLPFPEPWYDGDTINGYCIVPVKAADELSRYGYELHNCASQYSRAVSNGDCFIYVVSNGDGKPIAMAEIARAEKPKLEQLKGQCNQAVAKPIQRAVRTWLTRQQRKNGAGRMPARVTSIGMPFADDDFDDDIPF